MDCWPYEDRSNCSLTSLLSAIIETLGQKRDNRTICTAGCDVSHHHRRIYLKSWPWLPTVTMPDHRVITTFTLVTFLLSFAAFTKVSVSVYTRKVFTWVSKLSYLSKPFTSKLGIYQHSTLEVSRCPSLQSSCVIPFEHLPSAFHCCSSS